MPSPSSSLAMSSPPPPFALDLLAFFNIEALCFSVIISLCVAFVVQKAMEGEDDEVELNSDFSRTTSGHLDYDQLLRRSDRISGQRPALSLLTLDEKCLLPTSSHSSSTPASRSPFLTTPTHNASLAQSLQPPASVSSQHSGPSIIQETRKKPITEDVSPPRMENRQGQKVKMVSNFDEESDMKDDTRLSTVSDSPPKQTKRRFSLFRRSNSKKRQEETTELPDLPIPTVTQDLELETQDSFPYPPTPYSPPSPCPSEPLHVLDLLYMEDANHKTGALLDKSQMSSLSPRDLEWRLSRDDPLLNRLYLLIGSMVSDFLEATFSDPTAKALEWLLRTLVMLGAIILLGICTTSLVTIVFSNFHLFFTTGAAIVVALSSAHLLAHLGH